MVEEGECRTRRAGGVRADGAGWVDTRPGSAAEMSAAEHGYYSGVSLCWPAFDRLRSGPRREEPWRGICARRAHGPSRDPRIQSGRQVLTCCCLPAFADTLFLALTVRESMTCK